MKIWLRILALLMVACMMLGCLAACGEDEDKRKDDDDQRTHEENEGETEDENPEKDNEGDAADKGAPKNMLQLNALSFNAPEDLQERESGEDYAYYANDNSEWVIASGTLDGTAYSDEGMASYYLEMMEDSYESGEVRHANGVPYTFAQVTEGLYEVCAFYYFEEYDYGWTICIYYEDEALTEELADYATSGVIDEDYDFASVLDIEEPETAEHRTVIAYVPDDWGAARIWAWQDGGDDVYDAWPGEKMEEDGGHYTMTIPGWANCVIINGNNGGIQTEDIFIDTWDAVWIVISQDGSYYEVFFEEPTAADLDDMGY